MIKVSKTKINDVLEIDYQVFKDHRGIYVETYNFEDYKNAGVTCDFIQDDYSFSSKGVLRGLHGDSETWKLISCPVGEIFHVVLDMREDSNTYGQWQGFYLDEDSHKQILMPPGVANGHYILSDRAMFHYKQSTYYNRKGQFQVYYNDPRFNIKWPLLDGHELILSDRDNPNV